MANTKALIAVLVIVIIIMALIMIRCMCWNWCKRNYCPNGCCVDENPVIVVLQDPVRPTPYVTEEIEPSAPPPPHMEEGEQETC
jgi:hypothetical protein